MQKLLVLLNALQLVFVIIYSSQTDRSVWGIMTELETREHILTVASALIAEKGFDKTSMNEIVRASGISKGGIYWHFKSKDEIIFAIVEAMFIEQLHFLEEILSGEGRADERFIALIDMIAGSLEQISIAMPSPIDVYAETMRKPELQSELKHFFRHYQELLLALIEQGNRDGDFSVDNPELTAFTFMSSIEGAILLHSVAQPEQKLADVLKRTTQIFLQGIKTTKGD